MINHNGKEYEKVSVQFSCLVASNSLWPHGLSMPGFTAHHQFPALAQTHFHRVSDAIQASHPLSSAGSQCEESRPWQRSWGRRPDNMQRWDQASGVPLDILKHLPPKPESAYLTALCFHLHFWHYGGLSPTTSLWKGANLELQLINLLVVTRVFQSKNSSDGSLACLTGLSGHMWLFTASQLWEARDAINFLRTNSFENSENY